MKWNKINKLRSSFLFQNGMSTLNEEGKLIEEIKYLFDLR